MFGILENHQNLKNAIDEKITKKVKE